MTADTPRTRTSRTSVGRPRKIAGQRGPADPAHPATTGDPVVEQRGAPATSDRRDPPTTGGPRRRTNLVLLVVVAVLLVIGAAETWYLTRDDSPAPSSSRPVVVGDATRGEAVETAARTTEDLFSTTYQGYDQQVREATAKTTSAFATKYQKTADGIRDAFVARRTRMQTEVVGQSVVQASAEQVQALLFLNQYVQKVVDGQPRTDYSQYRALVTVVRTEHGWLVSDITTS
ncbi:hypothetical protein [Nocardioides sp.]|uniref:hypothetical protein n=1 Tax=Nocardioides sp. TaxID=35761 RepID=UPI003783A48F